MKHINFRSLMNFRNGLVINPDVYNAPTYRIGPFTTDDIRNNHLFYRNGANDKTLDVYIQTNFGTNYNITSSGKDGIYQALNHYNLKENDVVTILTTSQNYYISSCVTNEIERFCKWNREITDETSLLFVNHEFGTVYPNMNELVATGLPIIEDCCTTFFSQDENNMVGKYGDFAIYSFPKFFPIQIGGILVINKETKVSDILSDDLKKYIVAVINHYLINYEQILIKRADVYKLGLEYYQSLGFTKYFEYGRTECPSVMMLNNNGLINDLQKLKNFLWDCGIHSSVFYGKDAFFIPSHQKLSEIDIIYIYNALKQAIKLKL